MAFLTSEQATRIYGSTVRLCLLAELQFASRTMFLWNGAGRVKLYSNVWEGVGAMGAIDGLMQTREPVSTKVTMSLSGVSQEVTALARASVSDVQGRAAYIWLQLMDAAWQPVGTRLPIFWGIMQRINIKRAEAHEDSVERICELEVENPFYGRSRPSAGRYNDADQQSKYPGDRFFRFIPVQKTQTITWPDY